MRLQAEIQRTADLLGTLRILREYKNENLEILNSEFAADEPDVQKETIDDLRALDKLIVQVKEDIEGSGYAINNSFNDD